jgi:[acyl-carrier-protein] S-malonyltransferase
VIAGTPAGIEAASAQAKQLGVKRATPLNVGGAFHTPLMRDAADGLTAELPAVPLSPPNAPVVSNGDAQPYDDADGWRSRLAVHVTDPVRWRTSMESIAGLDATRCLEVGHGSMLATLAKRIVADLPVQGVATPDDLPALTEVS